MNLLEGVPRERRGLWARAAGLILALRTPQQGDVYGQPMPAGVYPAGDPRNDPEFAVRHEAQAAKVDRYLGVDIPSITKAYLDAKKEGHPLSHQQVEALIRRFREHKRDLAHGVGGATDELYDRLEDEKGSREVYTPDRERLHKRILDQMEREAIARGVPLGHKAIVFGGPSGAGKSAMLAKYGEHLGVQMGPDGKPSNYVVLNPDDFKDRLREHTDTRRYPGLGPNELASLLHEESSTLNKAAVRRFMSKGYNVINDVAMPDAAKGLRNYVEGPDPEHPYSDSYEFTHAIVDGDIRESRHNAGLRYKFKHHADTERNYGGRFLDMDVVNKQTPTKPGYRSKNAEQSEIFGNDPRIDHVAVFDPTAEHQGRNPLTWQKHNGKGHVSLAHPGLDLTHDLNGRASSLHSGVSLEWKEATTIMPTSTVRQRVKDFLAGKVAREDLVVFLANKQYESGDEDLAPTHDYKNRHWQVDGGIHNGGVNTWDEVRAMHESGQLPHDVYMDVVTRKAARAGKR